MNLHSNGHTAVQHKLIGFAHNDHPCTSLKIVFNGGQNVAWWNQTCPYGDNNFTKKSDGAQPFKQLFGFLVGRTNNDFNARSSSC